MLYSLCYISNALKLLPQSQLRTLNNFCMERNNALNVTGVLVYVEGTFIEVLEGEKSDLDKIFSEIKIDERHDQITIMFHSPIEHRSFKTYYTASQFSSQQKFLNALESEMQGRDDSKYSKKLRAIFKPFCLPAHTFLSHTEHVDLP